MRVSILGCGWIGLALQQKLEDAGHVAHCLTHEREANHARGVYHADVLVIAIPPSASAYLEVLHYTVAEMQKDTLQILFLSSVSFYEGKPAIVEAEEHLHRWAPKAVILRLGGLMGYDRIAGRYSAGKTLSMDTISRYIHRDDVLGVICAVMEQGTSGEVLDVVAPAQAYKSEIFSDNAKKFGFEKTQVLQRIPPRNPPSSSRLEAVLGYRFIRPDVMAFWK